MSGGLSCWSCTRPMGLPEPDGNGSQRKGDERPISRVVELGNLLELPAAGHLLRDKIESLGRDREGPTEIWSQ